MFYDKSNNSENCPQSFFNNCLNRYEKCSRCKAADVNNSQLLYVPNKDSPANLNYKMHPCYVLIMHEKVRAKSNCKSNKKNTAGYKYRKLGLKKEQKVLEDNSIDKVFGSGKYNEKGDGKLNLKGTEYKIEHKTRFNNRNIYALSNAEWDKCFNQGIDIGFISSEKGTYVNLKLEVFLEIIELVND